MSKHIGIETTHIGKFLPLITGHFPQHITLPVDDFIVGEGKHVVLAIGVHHAKSDIVLMELPEPRINVEIIQHIVHPAHVPFHVET